MDFTAKYEIKQTIRGSVVVDWLFIVGVFYCSMFCCMFFYVYSSFAIILMGKRELVALLKGIDYCPIEIIKGLTDKGQFQYLTKLKRPNFFH